MTHHFHINAKFKVVTVRLLIPQNDNSVLDRLIDHRGDHPDQLIAVGTVGAAVDLSGAEAEQYWLDNQHETIEIPLSVPEDQA